MCRIQRIVGKISTIERILPILFENLHFTWMIKDGEIKNMHLKKLTVLDAKFRWWKMKQMCVWSNDTMVLILEH